MLTLSVATGWVFGWDWLVVVFLLISIGAEILLSRLITNHAPAPAATARISIRIIFFIRATSF
jgi:hypothetical protein